MMITRPTTGIESKGCPALNPPIRPLIESGFPLPCIYSVFLGRPQSADFRDKSMLQVHALFQEW